MGLTNLRINAVALPKLLINYLLEIQEQKIKFDLSLCVYIYVNTDSNTNNLYINAYNAFRK